MQTATILSHLTPLQWKKAWSKLVVEDTPEGVIVFEGGEDA